ncbi:MAG: thioredoxin family protein, partial [Propionicimonas sp.]
AGPAPTVLDATRLGGRLGSAATFVQFSAEICAPCRATARVLGEVVDEVPGVAHVELDAASRLDLVEDLGITRTPTVLLLDGNGAVRNRIVGAARKGEILAALEVLSAGQATPNR